jgi:uncharacterized membrane protein
VTVDYRVAFPDGAFAITRDRPHVTHAVVVNTSSGWATWAGYGRDTDAQDEAACLADRGRDVQVVPVTPIPPSFNPAGGRRHA